MSPFECSTLLQNNFLNTRFGSQWMALLKSFSTIIKELAIHFVNTDEFQSKVIVSTVVCLDEWSTTCERPQGRKIANKAPKKYSSTDEQIIRTSLLDWACVSVQIGHIIHISC